MHNAEANNVGHTQRQLTGSNCLVATKNSGIRVLKLLPLIQMFTPAVTQSQSVKSVHRVPYLRTRDPRGGSAAWTVIGSSLESGVTFGQMSAEPACGRTCRGSNIRVIQGWINTNH